MKSVFAVYLFSIFLGFGWGSAPKTTHEIGNSVPKQLSPSVIQLKQIKARQPSSGKARIRVLAQGQNAFLGQLWIAPNAGVPLHRDVSEEYLYVLEGGGELTINGEVSQISVGSAIFMPANAEVSFANGNAPTVVLQVFADPASAKKYGQWEPVSK